MQRAQHDLSGIIEIMNRLYLEILEVETMYGIVFGNGDFRPRIEYFHDAIRSLTSGNPNVHEQGGRLSVEMLAYDVSALRYIQSMPLSSLNRNDRPRSPGTDLVKAPATGTSGKPDRNAKLRLTELYQQYNVLFAALFKSNADDNFHSRVEELNDTVKQVSDVLSLIQCGASAQALQDAIAHVDDPALKSTLTALLRQNRKNEIIQQLKDTAKAADRSIATLDKAHLQYASAQLAMYEEGRDIVKKLAARGMNLAGRFVENAMAQARRDMGAGRGN